MIGIGNKQHMCACSTDHMQLGKCRLQSGVSGCAWVVQDTVVLYAEYPLLTYIYGALWTPFFFFDVCVKAEAFDLGEVGDVQLQAVLFCHSVKSLGLHRGCSLCMLHVWSRTCQHQSMLNPPLWFRVSHMNSVQCEIKVSAAFHAVLVCFT